MFVDNNKFLSDTRPELKNLKNSNIPLLKKQSLLVPMELILENSLSTEKFMGRRRHLGKIIDYSIRLINAFEEIDLGRLDVINFSEFAENNRQSYREIIKEFMSNFTEAYNKANKKLRIYWVYLQKL